MEWVRELDRALDLYNAHDDTGCIAYVNSVLRDTTPGYPRARYYALLACCLDDWREADVSFLHTCSDLQSGTKSAHRLCALEQKTALLIGVSLIDPATPPDFAKSMTSYAPSSTRFTIFSSVADQTIGSTTK